MRPPTPPAAQTELSATEEKWNFPHPPRNRKSIRLRNYDYSLAGAYFVTICLQHKSCLLGKIRTGEMQLNAAGLMVADQWQGIVERFPGVELDEYVIMPNHLHGIVMLSSGISLSRVIRAFKSITTHEYISGVKQNGWREFPGRLWQRNYWNRVIRSECELALIREYIRNNPLKWELDKLYVAAEPEL